MLFLIFFKNLCYCFHFFEKKKAFEVQGLFTLSSIGLVLSIASTVSSFTMDPTDFLHYFSPQLIYSDRNKHFWPIVCSYSFSLHVFLPWSLNWLRAKHMLWISLRDPNPENSLSTPTICNDITSSLTACQQIVTALASLIFLSLLPHSKPLESTAQTHTIKIRSKGKNHFIKNHRNKWTTSFTNSVWTGD